MAPLPNLRKFDFFQKSENPGFFLGQSTYFLNWSRFQAPKIPLEMSLKKSIFAKNDDFQLKRWVPTHEIGSKMAKKHPFFNPFSKNKRPPRSVCFLGGSIFDPLHFFGFWRFGVILGPIFWLKCKKKKRTFSCVF